MELQFRVDNRLVVFILVGVVSISLIGIIIAQPNPGHTAAEVDGALPSGYCMFTLTSSSCPSGWTEQTMTGRFMRIAGSGAGTLGGSDTHTHSTGSLALTIAQIPAHTHPPPAGANNYMSSSGNTHGTAGNSYGTYPDTGSAGGGGSHNHGPTGSSSNIPQYVNVVVCCKN